VLCRAHLDRRAAAAVRATCDEFADEKLREDELALTIVDLRDLANIRRGSFRGDAPTFPASVIKLFYLAAAQQWLEEGKLTDSDELQRAMSDMIVDSSNDATAMFVESLTQAPGGEPVVAEQMKEWSHRRNAVNRYFASLGYTIGGEHGINACQKTYCEGPYGRERIFLGPKFENRNKLTTDATARLLAEIVTGKSVTPARSQQMMKLLQRDRTAKSGGADDQAHGFIAKALAPGDKLWSKAGWTSTARHDAAYVETEDGLRVILVIFTSGHSRNREILPALARRAIDGLRKP
jgi:beta-lactamase class A